MSEQKKLKKKKNRRDLLTLVTSGENGHFIFLLPIHIYIHFYQKKKLLPISEFFWANYHLHETYKNLSITCDYIDFDTFQLKRERAKKNIHVQFINK